jgi:nickel-type superoxide dismutase maturation protease
MVPALFPGDYLLVWRGIAGRPLRVKPGQLIIARHPERPQMLLVKRAAWREPDGWWLSSDNPRAGAVDSAQFGLVAPELIEGRLLMRYWPARRR